MATDSLSLRDARRIALAAHGFGQPRPAGQVTAGDMARVVRKLGLLQIDYVNVLAPAHHLVIFSRLGPYSRPALHELLYRSGKFTEQWAHEASIVPAEVWPLLRHRMATRRLRPYGFDQFLEENAGYADWALEQVRQQGPMTAERLASSEGVDRRFRYAWSRTAQRAVLEAHFTRGTIAIADRLPNYARSYDLAERVLGREHLERRIEPVEAQRELLRRAAGALGVATAEDLADYYRMPVRDAKPGIAELAEAGEIRPVTVEGWRSPAYLHRDARLPRAIETAAVLSPFDPVVWFRPRAVRLFDFEYRIEIYTPAHQRKWGYYVLPFLHGERLAGRVDLKAERSKGELVVPGAYLEGHGDAESTADAMARELKLVAQWLALDSVRVAARDRFARQLAQALRNVGE
jgi:uncharacterized protein YcaQ